MRARPADIGRQISETCRKTAERIFRWGKQHGTTRKTKHRGIAAVAADFMRNLDRLQSRAHPQAHRRLMAESAEARKPAEQTENRTTKDGNGLSHRRFFQQIAKAFWLAPQSAPARLCLGYACDPARSAASRLRVPNPTAQDVAGSRLRCQIVFKIEGVEHQTTRVTRTPSWHRARKNRSFTSYSVTATNGWSRPSGRIALLSGLVRLGITRLRLIG